MRLAGKNRTLAQTLGVVVVMGALAWASVPFYDWFCRTTGFGGATVTAQAPADQILDQVMDIRFDGNVDRDMPWQFGPVANTMQIRIGETGLAFFEATNLSDRPIAGTASFNVTPYEAGGYFVKIACFCFELQVLQPGETVQMPVSFYVDPEITRDRDAKFVKSITLSYTFHETDLPEEFAAMAGPQGGSN